jgi:hypothetical protein
MNIRLSDLPHDLRERLRPTKAPARAARADLGGFRSKLERDYAKHLDLLKAGGAVADWRYEPITIRLAGGTRYTPDFLVYTPDDPMPEAHEVKGYLWAKDAVRLREARPALAWLPIRSLVVVRRIRGQWVYDDPAAAPHYAASGASVGANPTQTPSQGVERAKSNANARKGHL